MDFFKALQYLPKVMKSWVGVLALAIVVMAALCLKAATTNSESANQETVRLLVGGCLIIICFALGLIVLVAIKYPQAFAQEDSIGLDARLLRYYLRGVRYDYLRSREGVTARINVMQLRDIDGDKALRITLVDYTDAYSEDETSRYWPQGRGKCGVAWQTGEQQYYAADDRSQRAAFVRMTLMKSGR
ncbi:MAG TPA: hypothetical protein VHC90_25025 [Bryobacteraceae bacterium]|nr:hypothetical protein [Bryobacteraceae bacterium]